MNRLIMREMSGDLTCRSSNFDKVFPTLYAYEETGMSPEEVHRMAEYWNLVPANIKSQITRIFDEGITNSDGSPTLNTAKRMLKPGDSVAMNDKYPFGKKYCGTIWTVSSEPYKLGGHMVVQLAGINGVYAVDGLYLVEDQEEKQ